MVQKGGWPIGKMLRVKWLKVNNRLFRDDLLFFMHIPKTAGTSFRYGAEEFFGKNRVDYDYGAESLVTSDRISKYFYGDSPDPISYLASCGNDRTRMVGGHVKLDRFVALTGISRTITFIREPLQRIASEYAHIVQHQDYCGSFKDFYTQSYMQNVMSRYFCNIDVEAVGFVGLSERYEECLNAINAVYDLRIPIREDNCYRALQMSLHELSTEDAEELRRINQRDILLYQYCGSLLDVRLQMMRSGMPYAFARMNISEVHKVSGWAWWGDGSDAPLEVEVLVNGVVVALVLASDLRQNLSYLQPPRRGHVGFHLSLKLKDGDEVQCRVAKTGQLFPPTPISVQIT